MHAAVIGSGPAALACAKALRTRGVRLTIFDVGQALDPARQALVKQLSEVEPDEWPTQAVDQLTTNNTTRTKEIPRKLMFGSDFVYAKDADLWPMDFRCTQARGTFARGGFSTIWGGAMLPADDCDIKDWPIRRGDLADSYLQVLSDIPLSANPRDALRHAFPLFKEDVVSLKLPPQAEALLQDFELVSAEGVRWLAGQSRLAVDVGDGNHNRGCRYCGICLSSCPYGAIYSTDREISKISDDGSVEYASDTLVERLEEGSRQVKVCFTDLKSGISTSRRFDRVFVGAGAINTTRIILESLGMYDVPVTMLDSMKFLLPLVRLQRTPLAWPKINALASLFVEVKLEEISNHWTHIQISLVNDFVLRRLRMQPNHRGAIGRRWLKPGLERLMIAWCSVHSDHSSRIELRLSSRKRSGRPVLEARDLDDNVARVMMSRIAWKIARLGLTARVLFLAPFARLSPTGVSGHYGGTFPMSASPAHVFSSDSLGRPFGLKRVHLVDASVFPSIPGTTMVLTIMANANRIASESVLIE